MIAVARRTHYTLQEYLSFEASSNVKHEYLDGQIFAMAGGTPEHAALAAGVVGQLYVQLRGAPRRVHSGDLRVRVPATGLVTYPDVTVVCGPLDRDPEDRSAVTNPTVIVEVLSPSTEDYDRGERFNHYKELVSLQEVVFIAHEQRRVEVWSRGSGGTWTSRTAADGQAAELTFISAILDVRELYARASDATE